MVGGAILCLWLIIYLVNRFLVKGSVDGDNLPVSIVIPCFMWFVNAVIFALLLEIFKDFPIISQTVLTFLLLFLLFFPSVISWFTVKLGMVKTSFYLGQLARVYFYRNYFAGGLLRGFQAVQKIKNEADKKQALFWLRSRYLTRKRYLFSGEIVMFIIIDSLIKEPDNYENLARQLSLLNGIPKKSVPKGVSLLAIKYSLAETLPTNDWQKVCSISKQWDTPAYNRIAKYLLAFHTFHFEASTIKNKLKYYWCVLFIWRFMWRFSAIKAWAISNKSSNEDDIVMGTSNDSAIPIESVWHAVLQKKCIDNALSDRLFSKENEIKWSERAKELGVWQFDGVWQGLLASSRVLEDSSEETEHNAISSDQSYLEIEEHINALKYIERSIEKKIEPRLLGTGIEHSIDWIKILNILDYLEVDKAAKISAFSGCYITLWNWIAALWNDKSEYRLAHSIANECLPLARECGYEDFEVMLLDILGRKK